MLKTSLLAGIVVLTLSTGVWAAEPPAQVPPAAPAATGKTAGKAADSTTQGAAVTPPGPAPAPAPPAASVMDAYMVELVAAVNLSDADKKQVEGYYTDDAPALKKILNDDSLSPLVKAQQVSDLRDARNARIESLLHDLDRQKAFLKVEAVYRVALLEYAAGDAPVPPAPAAAAPAPAAMTNAAPAKPAAPPAAK